MVSTAGLATGVGAAPAVIQLIWALSSAAGQAAIKQAVNSALSRKGKRFSAANIAETIADTLEGAIGFFLVNELEVGLKLQASAALDGPEKIVTGGAIEFPITKLKSMLSDIKDGMVNALKQDEFAKHSLDTLGSSLTQTLKKQLQHIPKELPEKFLTSATTEIANLTFNAITQGNYHDTTDITKLYRDEDTGGLSEEKKRKALGNLFNFTNEMNNAAQFQGGPSDLMGSDTWIGLEGYGNFAEHLGHASKTAGYEFTRDFAVEKLGEKIKKTLTSDSEDGDTQTSESSESVPEETQMIQKEKVMKIMLESMGLRVPRNIPNTPYDIIKYVQDNVRGMSRDEVKKTLSDNLKKFSEEEWLQYIKQKTEVESKWLQDMEERAEKKWEKIERDQKSKLQLREAFMNSSPAPVRPFLNNQPEHVQDFTRDEVGRDRQGREDRHEDIQEQARQQEVQKSREKKKKKKNKARTLVAE
ncbi:MAG: hypothetical protein EBE86_006255 [Hormoscilla sp. GUM202]|nr:hypothetical protein [Hormoscilla sp. GUM202]